MPLTKLIRTLIPFLILLPQVHAIASVSTSRANLIAQATAPAKELGEVRKELAESTKKLEELQKNFDALKDDQKKKLEDQQKYNSDLMNTVFFSLLGSVLTVASAILGFQFFAQVLDRDRQKRELVEEAKSHLQYYTDKKLYALEVRIAWLEYQIATVAANQSERDGGISELVAIQDRLRAIQALLRLSSKYQQERALKPINSEIMAIQFSLARYRELENVLPIEEQQEKELIRFKEKVRKNAVRFFDKFVEDSNFHNLGLEKNDINSIRELLNNLEFTNRT